MGYYSDVAITLKKEDMMRLFKEAIEAGGNIADFVRYGTLIDSGDGTMTLKYIGTKWYESFPDVSFVESFVHVCSCYHFLRIGEDLCDVEELYGDDDESYDLGNNAYFSREIIVDGDMIDIRHIMDAIKIMNSITDKEE